MNRTYREARRNNVPAQIAYQIANPVRYRSPFSGDTLTEGAITYTLKVEPDDVCAVTDYGDIEQYARESDLPDDALVISECDSRHYGYYIAAETWAELWPQATDPKARAWLFENQYARSMRELIENGYHSVEVTATDPEGRELARVVVCGFDDWERGACELLDECRAEVQSVRAKARKERREAAYWRNRGIETVAA